MTKVFFFIPNAGHVAYNALTRSGDNLSLSNNTLSLTTWSAKPACGIRITEDNTELNKPKIMDSITFSDNTTQSKGYSDESIFSLIDQKIELFRELLIPCGTVFAYAGSYYNMLLQPISPSIG